MILFCTFSEHDSFYLSTCAINKEHWEYFSQFSSFVIELSVWFFKDSHNNLPIWNINKEVSNFVIVFQLLIIELMFLHIHSLIFFLQFLSSSFEFYWWNRSVFFSLFLACCNSLPVLELHLLFDLTVTVIWRCLVVRLEGIKWKNFNIQFTILFECAEFSDFKEIFGILAVRFSNFSQV